VAGAFPPRGEHEHVRGTHVRVWVVDEPRKVHRVAVGELVDQPPERRRLLVLFAGHEQPNVLVCPVGHAIERTQQRREVLLAGLATDGDDDPVGFREPGVSRRLVGPREQVLGDNRVGHDPDPPGIEIRVGDDPVGDRLDWRDDGLGPPVEARPQPQPRAVRPG